VKIEKKKKKRLYLRPANYLKLWEPSPNSRRQKDDMKHMKDPEFGSLTVLWRYLLGAYELTHKFFYLRKKTAILNAEILSANVQNLTARATRRPEFVRLWATRLSCNFSTTWKIKECLIRICKLAKWNSLRVACGLGLGVTNRAT